MKTKDQLYQRENVILRPRVVLKANLQCDSQDLLAQEARSSWESQQKMRRATEKPEAALLTTEYLVYRSQRWNCRMHGEKKVTKLIEMFEKHQQKEQFLKDTSQKQEINKFSEESQQLLVDMNHTEIFELSENCEKKTSMSWLQCLFRNLDLSLQLREKFEVLAESYNITEDQVRFDFNPWLLSLRRIQVEDQNMVSLKDRWCSTGRSRC